MEGWKSAELQNAEREYEEINEALLTEVSLSVPAVSEPIQIPITPVSAPQFAVNPTVPVSHSSGIASDPKLQEMQERVSALHKPYLGISIPPVSGVPMGFNFGQDGQANVPPVFNMGSAKPVQRERHVHFQKEPSLTLIPLLSLSVSQDWYYSEFGRKMV